MKNIRCGTTSHSWKFECFHYTRWKILCYSLKKSKFSFYFIVYRPMRVSNVISNVTIQNMNVMASMSKGQNCVSDLPLQDLHLFYRSWYNKKKIQMFVMNMTFISSREVKKMYISFVPSALMKYTFFHFTRWNNSHIHFKHLNILYLFYYLHANARFWCHI